MCGCSITNKNYKYYKNKSDLAVNNGLAGHWKVLVKQLQINPVQAARINIMQSIFGYTYMSQCMLS